MKCCFCGKEIKYGNNIFPLSIDKSSKIYYKQAPIKIDITKNPKEKCCDMCNEFVIAARILLKEGYIK